MDFSEIIKNVKERLSNPFVFSYILSFLLVNWQLTVGIFWLNETQLNKEGYRTLIDFINCQTVDYTAPFGYAAAYTLLIPILKYLIKAFHALVSLGGDKVYFWISKKSDIPMSLFMSLSDDIDKRQVDLNQRIKANAKLKTKYEGAITKLNAQEQQIENFKLDIQYLNDIQEEILKSAFDVRLLNGVWECAKTFHGNTFVEIVKIQDGEIYVTRGTQSINEYHISNYYFNDKEKSMFFIKYSKPEVLSQETYPAGDNTYVKYEVDSSNVELIINDLKVLDEKTIKGFESSKNEKIEIEYTKKSST